MLGLHALSLGLWRQSYKTFELNKFQLDKLQLQQSTSVWPEAVVHTSAIRATQGGVFVNNLSNNSNANGNNNLNNNGRFLLIAHCYMMNLYSQLCAYQNLFNAYQKARKHKTLKSYVIEFEQDLENNLLQLQSELLLHAYRPKPLVNFVIRDPKTRKISKSAFRDRIVHHALGNIIEPIFEKSFIYDSYANRIGKGVFKAIARYKQFSRKITYNYTRKAFVMKADIKHYFETVDHKVLLSIVKKKITDKRIIWLIGIILSNHQSDIARKGMPLGNLTSQFLANVYLNELDQYVKHHLKVRYYIRYVDDFVIMDISFDKLEQIKLAIGQFLKEELQLEFHPTKNKINLIPRGIEFLGFKIFCYHILIKSKNLRKFRKKLAKTISNFDSKNIDYDQVYDFMEGWLAYAKHANTYKLRKKVLEDFEEKFTTEISSKEISRAKT